MKARDVMSETYSNSNTVGRGLTAVMLDALLATTPDGEGVYIGPDGTLMRLGRTDERWHVSACMAVMGDCSCPDVPLYRLVPIEGAEL